MSFATEYFRLRKKREEEEKAKAKAQAKPTKVTGNSFAEEYSALREQRIAEEAQKQTEVFEDDIAPVRSTTSSKGIAPEKEEKKDKWYHGWLDSGAFEDGWDFGDVTKTILGTLNDVSENTLEAVGVATENIIDSGAEIIGGIGGMFGNKEFEQDMYEWANGTELLNSKETAEKFNRIINWTNGWGIATNILLGNGTEESKLEDYSVLDDKSDSLVQSAADMIGAQALKAVPFVGAVLSPLAMFNNSYRAEMRNAYESGATLEEARTSAAISGGAEILFENIGGLKVFNKLGLDDVWKKALSKKVSNSVIRTVLAYLGDTASEGFEEVATDVVSRVGQKLTYMDEKTWKEMLASEEALNSYIDSAVGGVVMGFAGGGTKVFNSAVTGRDYVTNLTKNEEAVVDKVYKDALAEAEKKGTLTKSQKNELYDSVVEQMNKGEISIDTIEEMFGGDEYKAYRDLVDSENKDLQEFAELYEGDELKAQTDNYMNESKRGELKSQLGQSVFEKVKGDRLARSYIENANKAVKFEADVTKYTDEYARKTMQNIIDSGAVNNTHRSHELADLMTKISADKQIVFSVTDAKKLAETSLGVKGRTINGFVTEGGITINIDSPKYLNKVIGHEVTHVLEGTEFYETFQEVVFEYAKTKGEYKTRLTEAMELYMDVDGYRGKEGFQKIKREVVADLVGDYIFTDTEFVKNLSVNHRNIFEKIYDEIKYLCKVATAGSKEARDLERAKKAFEDAYRADTVKKTDAKKTLSISKVDYDGVSETDKASAEGVIKNLKTDAMSAKYGIRPFATYSQERIDRELKISSSDTAQDYAKSYITWIDPIDFIYATTTSEQGRATLRDEAGDLNIEKLKNETQPIHLTVNFETGEITGHEGRHRMLALQKAGINRVAVIIDALNDNRHNTKPVDMMRLKGQNFGEYRHGMDFYVHDMLPLSKRYADVARDMFANTPKQGVQYSLSNADSLSDSDGNKLTEAQGEYFKDSQIRDDNGNLKVVYHGSGSEFTEFSYDFMSSHGSSEGQGFYFTDSEKMAKGYQQNGAELMKGYLDIKKPLSDSEITIKRNELSKLLKAIDPTGDDVLINYDPTGGMGYPSKAWYNRALAGTVDSMLQYNESDSEILADIANSGAGTEAVLSQIRGLLGYDGYIVKGKYDGADVYVAFESNQFKNIDNQNPTADPDIRYSLSEAGLDYDAKSGTVSYSLTSLNDAFDADKGVWEYVAARNEYETELAKHIAEDPENVTAEEKAKAHRYVDNLFLIGEMIANDRDRLDYEAAVNKYAWVSNSEYGGSIDFSTLCAKRRIFTGTFDAIQEALPDIVLNENDFLEIRNLLLESGVEAPCSMCYVEGSRAKHGVYVAKFLKDYLQTNPEWRPQIADFTSSNRLEQTRIQHPKAYNAYQEAMNKLAQRKPKEASVRTDYKGEILRDFANSTDVAQKNLNGGVRFNSFSDFEIIHALDCMQVMTDMSRVGLNGQAYTKVKEFAEAFGNTGLKINLSLVAKDVDENGNLIFDEVNGMKHSEANDLRNRYSDNVGTVIVVFNDAQLKAALADSTIDYVLPFHRSQWKKSQYEAMGLPEKTKEYTVYQNDKVKNPKTGRWVNLGKIKHKATYTNDITGETYEITGNIMPNQYWDYNASGRENAQRYLDYINANGLAPKFYFLLDNVDGKWVLPEGGVGDGYFKLLIDFKMYNNEGIGSPQNPVTPEFNMDFIQEMLNDYKGGHKAFPVAQDVVDKFVAKKQIAPARPSMPQFELAKAMSLSSEDAAPVAHDRNLISSEDVRLQTPVEDVAPAKETQTEVVDAAPAASDLISEADANAMQTENIESITDEDMPPMPEEPYYGEPETPVAPKDPFDERDFYSIGKNRKVKAFMWDNPEVKPYFQEAARDMLSDLDNSDKAERWYNDELYYETNGEYGYGGTPRNTTEDIAYLLDNTNDLYEDIRRGLNAIIEDNGKENNAVSKRIEFILNDRLMKGYTDVFGNKIPANQDYIDLLSFKQTTDEAYRQYQKSLEYIEDDVAPSAEPVAPAPVKEKSLGIKPKREKANSDNKMVRVKSESAQMSQNTEERRWVGTSTSSEAVDGAVTPDDIPDELRYYQVKGNKQTLETANTRLSNMGYDRAVTYFKGKLSERRVTVEDIALGERLIQEAVKAGDTKTAMDLIADVSILGTELGQKVQALSIIKKLTPEGQLGMLQKVVERGKAKGDKAYDGVEVTEAQAETILKTRKKDGTFDQNELNKAVEDVKQQIADQMKVTGLEKVNAWRYLSMLGNPKTHIRNLVSNVAMRGTIEVKNALARTIEDIAPVKSRTKTWKSASDVVKAYAQETAMEMKEIISDGGKYNEEASLKAMRKTFKNKVLNGVYEFNSDMLSREDWWFSKSVFQNSFSEFLTANGIVTEQDILNNPETIEKARNYALEQSQIATFRQYSWLANKINEIERKNIATNIAVGAIVPFKKTPINIAKTGLNYSPLGFAKTLTYDIAQVKNGNMEASELIDHLSQNITGSALTLVGFMLASAGFLNGGGEDDKEGKYDYQLGEQAYSVNIGGATFSLSWLSPIAMPLFVGANAYEQLVEGKEWNGDVVVETLAQTLDPLSEMSFLSSLDSVLSSYDSGIQKFAGIGESMVQNYVTQFVPTLSSQLAATIDDTKRTTKVSGDSDFKFFDQTINNLKYKIPFLRQTLEPTTDIWGNEVMQTENVIARAVENFIAPYARRENIATEIDEEIKELYGETGDSGLIPSVPYNYVNYDGEKYEMSAKEFTEYKKLYGQNAYDLMEDLFATSVYQNATDEEKAEMINKIYDYARDEATKSLLEGRNIRFTNAESEGTKYYRENPIKGAIENNMYPDEYTFYTKYPEKYRFLKDEGVSYKEWDAFDEDTKRAYTWLYENPSKKSLVKAVTNDIVKYRSLAGDMYDIKADKDASGKSISGSRKEKVVDYINGLDLDYGEKIILFKSEYNADDTYNWDIVSYLNSREDISYAEMETILKELGFTVSADGSISW